MVEAKTDDVSKIVDEKTVVGDDYDIPEPPPFVSFDALKGRIRHHYELASDYYYRLWGEHIHRKKVNFFGPVSQAEKYL